MIPGATEIVAAESFLINFYNVHILFRVIRAVYRL